MIFGKTKLELKVGFFVFIGLFILVTFILSLGGFRTWTSGYRVNFIFNFANGIKLGAPVRFAGIDTGEVKNIKFFFVPEEQKTKVQVVCWITKNVRVPMDSTIWVNTLGLLGEKYIEIMPGRDYSSCLKPNGSLVGIDPIAMHEVVRLAKDIATNWDEAITRINKEEGTIGKLLYDDAIYKELEALIMDVRKHPWKLFYKTKEKPEKK